MLIDLLYPILHVDESLFLRAIVHKDDPHRTFIVSLSNCSKSLLTGGVPDLQLDFLIIYVNCLDLEVDS